MNCEDITRFDLDMDGSFEPSEHGSWVRYEDHVLLLAAQRQWVGLTDEDVIDLRSKYQPGHIGSFVDLIAQTATKLKEKNHG